jgi:hypothetical protein
MQHSTDNWHATGRFSGDKSDNGDSQAEVGGIYSSA